MKKLFSVLICIILFGCTFSQSYVFDAKQNKVVREYDKLQTDSSTVRIMLVDGLEVEMMSVIKITTDTTPIGISPYQTITVESTVPWTMVVGDSTIQGDAGTNKIKLWSDKIEYIDISPKDE